MLTENLYLDTPDLEEAEEVEGEDGGEEEDIDNRPNHLAKYRNHDLTQQGVEWGGWDTILVFTGACPEASLPWP